MRPKFRYNICCLLWDESKYGIVGILLRNPLTFIIFRSHSSYIKGNNKIHHIALSWSELTRKRDFAVNKTSSIYQN